MKPAQLTRAFRYGQALAAWNCGFEGARGGMYASTRSSFERQIEKLLAGGVPALTSPGESPTRAESPACPACVA
jgi:fructokinase